MHCGTIVPCPHLSIGTQSPRLPKADVARVRVAIG